MKKYAVVLCAGLLLSGCDQATDAKDAVLDVIDDGVSMGEDLWDEWFGEPTTLEKLKDGATEAADSVEQAAKEAKKALNSSGQ